MTDGWLAGTGGPTTFVSALPPPGNATFAAVALAPGGFVAAPAGTILVFAAAGLLLLALKAAVGRLGGLPPGVGVGVGNAGVVVDGSAVAAGLGAEADPTRLVSRARPTTLVFTASPGAGRTVTEPGGGRGATGIAGAVGAGGVAWTGLGELPVGVAVSLFGLNDGAKGAGFAGATLAAPAAGGTAGVATEPAGGGLPGALAGLATAGAGFVLAPFGD